MINHSIKRTILSPRDDEVKNYYVDMGAIWEAIQKGKLLIASITAVCIITSVIYALQISDVYRSTTLLSPVSNSNSTNQSPLGLGAVAGLAGINLGSATSSQTSLALAILRSKQFVLKFVLDSELEPELVASTGWNAAASTLIYDNEIYDEQTNEWKIVDGVPATPSQSEIIESFLSRLEVSEDPVEGYVTVSFEFYSPIVAQEVLSSLIAAINQEMKRKDIAEAQQNIEYLTGLVSQTSIIQMQQAIYSVIESEVRRSMLASVKDDYVFEYIDPPYIPEIKSGPARRSIVLFSCMAGLFFSVFLVVLMQLIKESKQDED